MPLHLTPTERSIVAILRRHPGQFVPTPDLIPRPIQRRASTAYRRRHNVFRVLLCGLRRKLPGRIETEIGKGARWVA